MLKASRILAAIGHILNFVMLGINVLAMVLCFARYLRWTNDVSPLLYFFMFLFFALCCGGAIVLSTIGKAKALNSTYSKPAGILFIASGILSSVPVLVVAGVFQIILANKIIDTYERGQSHE